MNAQQFHEAVLKEVSTYTFDKVDRFFVGLENGDGADQSYAQEVKGVYKDHPCPFYPYIACAARLSNTQDAVELGADRGASALFIQSEIPGTLWSVDISVDGANVWKYIPKDVKRVVKIIGSSVNPYTLRSYDLSKAKFWLIDSEHTDEHFQREIDLYKNRWNKGTVVMCDDIISTWRAWEKLPYDKYADKEGNVHGNGTGIFIV